MKPKVLATAWRDGDDTYVEDDGQYTVAAPLFKRVFLIRLTVHNSRHA